MAAPDDAAIRQAMSRLNALYELEPAAKPKGNWSRLASLAFAAASWSTLALVLAEQQPWRF